MYLIAIETSTDACSAALLSEQGIIDRFEMAPRLHAQRILPMLDALLAQAGIKAAQLDAIAFARGPGAFTGVRIAAGVAQGLALATERPVIAVSTLAAMAQEAMQCADKPQVMAALDARMSEVYWGCYQRDAQGDAVLVMPERVIGPAQVPLPPGEPWYGVGSGWSAYEALLQARLGSLVQGVDPALVPKAHYVAQLALRDFNAGGGVPAERAEPVYLRDQVVRAPT